MFSVIGAYLNKRRMIFHFPALCINSNVLCSVLLAGAQSIMVFAKEGNRRNSGTHLMGNVYDETLCGQVLISTTDDPF